MATVRGQVPVQGTCAKGHVTQAVSDKGRVTWNGPCSEPGCGLRVTARRIPSPGHKPGSPPPAPDAGGGDHSQVIEVEYDRDDPDPGPNAGGADDGGGDPDQPAGEEPPDGVEPDPAPEPEPEPQPRRGDGRYKRRRRRLTRAERRAARAKASEEWIVPNILPR